MTEATNVDRLIQTILDAAQRALDRASWSEARKLAGQVLEIIPDEPAARALLSMAEERSSLPAADQGRRFLTVLFSDVVGSTSLSERLDAEDYLMVISGYREVVRAAVARHAGHLDQFQGDGVVVYFGFPTPGEDDQIRAIETGLDIVAEVPMVGERHGLDLAARVGVHVGRTVMTGSELGMRDQSAAIGFAANVAARVQGCAEPGTVVVSESAADFVSQAFLLEPIGARKLRGMSKDTQVFRVGEPRARSTMLDNRLEAPLVGRLDEQQRIDAAWRAASSGGDASRTIVVVGEPGIGKSRVARYAMDLARDANAPVIEINCGRSLRNVGLGAVCRAIENTLGLGPAPTSEVTRAALWVRAEAVGLSPDAVRVLESVMDVAMPGESTPELTPDRRREAIITALVDWITAESSTAPVALVVEDLHWADDTCIEALRRLTAVPLPRGLLLLMTSRADGMPTALRRTMSDACELGPLVGDATKELVRAVAGRQQLDDDLVDELAQRSEGVPLFTEQLVLQATSGSAPDHVSNSLLPATLEGLLQVRINASGPGRGMAEIAAIVGGEFSLDLLERALVELGTSAPLQPAALPAAARALQRAGLIESASPGLLRFRHSLVRDAAYELQLRGELARRHRAVAHALAETQGTKASPSALAFHFARAGDLEPAASAYLRAAQSAADLAEFDTALAHLRAAEAIIERLDGPDALRLELDWCMQIGTVSAASFSYTREDAVRAYRRALDLCDLIGESGGSRGGLDVQLLGALGGLWSKEVVAGDLPAARTVTDRLERLMAQSTPSDLTPEILRFVRSCRGFEQLYAGRSEAAVTTLRAASEVADAGPVAVSLGMPHDYVSALDAVLAAGLTLTGEDRAADAALSRALRRTRQLPFPIGPFSEALVQIYAAYVHRLRRDVRAARIAAGAASEIGDRHGFREHSMLGQILLLAASMPEGDPATCQALENALGIWRMAGGGLGVPVLLTELAEGWSLADNPQQARQALREATTMMEATGQRGCEAEIVRLSALLDAAEGRASEEVTEMLMSAAELALEQGSLRLAARAVRSAASVRGPEGARGPVAGVAAQLCSQLPTSGPGEIRTIERLVSASG